MKIYKYRLVEISPHGEPVFSAFMPRVAKILKCGFQGNSAYVWALVEPSVSETNVAFLILPTGADAPEANEATHLETVFVEGYVWHFFVSKDANHLVTL